MTGSSVSGHRPGSHFGLSKEPFSGGNPPLPSGATSSQQVDSAALSAGAQAAGIAVAVLFVVSSPSPHATETRVARQPRIATAHVARCRMVSLRFLTMLSRGGAVARLSPCLIYRRGSQQVPCG